MKLRAMVTSLDRGQAAAAPYLHLASPAEDALKRAHNRARTTERAQRAAALRGSGGSGGPGTHPGLSTVYFHSRRNPGWQIAAGQGSTQVKLGLTLYTSTICQGGWAFYQ